MHLKLLFKDLTELILHTEGIIKGGDNMTLNVALQPILAIIAGVLILAVPRLLNYIIAIFLIVFGILGLIQ